jgi:hypothetical protein
MFDFSIAESVLKAGVRKTEGFKYLVKEPNAKRVYEPISNCQGV